MSYAATMASAFPWFIGACQHFHDLTKAATIEMMSGSIKQHIEQNVSFLPAAQVAVFNHVVNLVNLATRR